MFMDISMAWLKLLLVLMFVMLVNVDESKVQGQESSTPVYLYRDCTSGGNTIANSGYELNLRSLLISLSSNAASAEFWNATVGRSSSDTVRGLFMCRGDVASRVCEECVVSATGRILSECPLAKEGVIWYDECMVRYSNRSFFSTVDTRPRVGLLNTANIINQESFMSLLFMTINKTADEAAYYSVGLKKYATNQANIFAYQSLYCLAQCTPDLSPPDCRTCLSGVIGDLPWCCNGKQGGRVLYPSCNVRYELYPFYRTITAFPPPSSPNYGGSSGISTGTTVGISVSIVVSVKISVGIYLLRRRARKKRDSVKDGESKDPPRHIEVASDINTAELELSE